MPPNKVITIQAQIAQLEAKLTELRSHVTLQDELLKWCKQHGANRSDLAAVYTALPPMFITRKMRQAALAGKKQPPSSAIGALSHYHQNKANINAKRMAQSRKTARPKPEYMEMANKLDAAVRAAGMNNSTVAKKIGCHDSLISTYRRGVYWPTPDKMEKLEKLFGIKLAEGAKP